MPTSESFVNKSSFTTSFEPRQDLTSVDSFIVTIIGGFSSPERYTVEIQDKKIDKNFYMAHVIYNRVEITRFPVPTRFVHKGHAAIVKQKAMISFWFTRERPGPVPAWLEK